ncbi:hypothetical protein M413DRAFT_19059 [Hebeloma cylindrosporum]|uniref:Rad4 beta-hairpin domain-containing protein n=1 Tax=Hebeloma cylindrosporum TaxID=76867 RepID=A0A0C3C9K2_HEBCY|nr:hypothetical protein M413DRAFT_19059 [Hebeloma cylindrosporum h7]
MDSEEDSDLQDDSEDEFDWEEVDVPEHQPEHLEITLQLNPKSTKAKGITHAERLIRIDCHKIHTIALISSARVRNHWLNDPLLHARLLSLTPLHLQNAFGMIHKSRVPDQNQRGRMFERAIEALNNWWSESFFEVIPEGHIRNRTFDEIQQKLEIRGLHVKNEYDPDATLDEEVLQDIVEDEVETIRSSKSLMKHALMRSGSRDTSAQLFTALCRAVGIPARLVVSVQSVPWQASVGRPKPKYERKPKGKGKETIVPENEVEELSPSASESLGQNGRRLDGEPVSQKSEKAKGKEKAKPVIKLRKQKSKGNVLGAGPSRLASPDPLTTPPVFWTEVFSRPDARWFPVDPVRGITNKRKAFDPSPSTFNPNAAPPSTMFPQLYASNVHVRRAPTKVENRMVYVVAFEEDSYARDVTRRYAKEYAAKVAKVQGGSSAPNVGGGGKGRQAWWDKVVHAIERPYRLHRDDLEDQELDALQSMEGMPTTIGGFKDHPLYVLVRHLKQTETSHPPPPTTAELGKFRGESVYPRSAVVSLKTAENWMRNTGRTVKEGEQPLKMVKVRAGTVNRMREVEVLKDELNVAGNGEGSSAAAAGGEIMQGLYAFSQTEPYVPAPVVDGKVPKNNFGNIDLYVPSMLPRGASHIPFKGVAKIARKLGFDYAEAVTGFEFKKRRAFPVIEGVVVAAENEAIILEAFWEAEREADEKAKLKREDRVLKQWTRLIHGLRIRQRLQDQYATKSTGKEHDHPQEKDGGGSRAESPHDELADSAGGFLAGADKVVKAFHLPKNTHPVLPPSASGSSSPHPATLEALPPNRLSSGRRTAAASSSRRHPKAAAEELAETSSDGDAAPPDFITYDLEEEEETMDVDSDMMEEVGSLSRRRHHQHVPKTLQQMAEDAARQQELDAGAEKKDDEIEEILMTSPITAAAGGGARRTRAATIKVPLPAKLLTPNVPSSTRSTPSLASGMKVKSSSKQQRSSIRRAPLRKITTKRKRTKARSESDSEDLSDQEEDENGDEDDEVASRPSPSKRARGKTAATAVAPVATPPSTRTLRPRATKTAAQVEEERQSEAAFRSAVAR